MNAGPEKWLWESSRIQFQYMVFDTWISSNLTKPNSYWVVWVALILKKFGVLLKTFNFFVF